jgi:hypothetical protein
MCKFWNYHIFAHIIPKFTSFPPSGFNYACSLRIPWDGQPQLGEDHRPTTRQVKLHFQHLLPKGAKSEEERQLFPLSKEAVRLLGEIKMLLEETYGDIPIVAPARSNSKREHLKPERYLFQ